MLPAILMLGGCGTSKPAPAEVTTYGCALGRGFQVTVRPGDDRVVLAAGPMRLLLGRPESADGKNKPAKRDSGEPAAAEGQFTNGAVTLVLAGEQATLEGAPGGPYDNCRATGPAEKIDPASPRLKVE